MYDNNKIILEVWFFQGLLIFDQTAFKRDGAMETASILLTKSQHHFLGRDI